MPEVNHTADKIAELSHLLASQRKGASASASAIMECTVGALEPMIQRMFSGGTLQERLLFSLVLTGACCSLEEKREDAHGLTVHVCPENLREAFRLYTTLTGKSIQSYLPTQMVQFAGIELLN